MASVLGLLLLPILAAITIVVVIVLAIVLTMRRNSKLKGYTGYSCENNSGCEPPLVCMYGKCAVDQECLRDSDCGYREYCGDGFCKSRDA